MRIASSHAQESGFTIVVIAALFIAFAVIGAAAVERNTVIQQITRRDATRDQLQKLANAIIEYSVFNRNAAGVNLYPCPALMNVTANSSSFGAGQTTANTYTRNCYDTTGDASGFTGEGANGVAVLGADIIKGMVPVLELSAYGISINDAFDPWNDRIIYVVNRTQTIGSPSPTQTNNPTLTDLRTSYSIAKPDFILISYGRDRVGAVSRANVASTVVAPCTNATTNPRFENCDTDTTFFTEPTYTAAGADTGGTYVYNAYFDDILTWYRQ